jgi:hypothetical protein
VVKPFDERRLAQTLGRVRHALGERAALAERQAAMSAYLGHAAPAGGLAALWGQRENESRVLESRLAPHGFA